MCSFLFFAYISLFSSETVMRTSHAVYKIINYFGLLTAAKRTAAWTPNLAVYYYITVCQIKQLFCATRLQI